MKAKVLKWGNSLAVRIPQVIAKDAHLKKGDAIELTAGEEGKIEVRKVSKIPTLAELVAQITPENRHDEISTRSPAGKELVEW
jgi:antitoxin MazE